MTAEERTKLLTDKPVLTDTKSRIKYAVFIGLLDRGWKGVGSVFSGVLTKNDFVLTLYKSDATGFILQEKSNYLVPTAVTCFNVPRASWTLERYNKLYASGKIQSLWDYLYDQPELIPESETFVGFLNEVDNIANMHELELQSIGDVYIEEGEETYAFSVYDGQITDTGVFMSLTDFGSIEKKIAYQIKGAEENDAGEKIFILNQLQPQSFIDIILDLNQFYEHYQSGDLIPLSVHRTIDSGNYSLVHASGSSMSGLPIAIQKLNFGLEKQKLIGTAIMERLYILPLLTASETTMSQVFDLLHISHEFDLLNHLPDDAQMLDMILEYARAGLSIYQPLTCELVSDAKFELNELLESIAYDKQTLGSEYGIAVLELIIYLRTFYIDIEPKPSVGSNYLYLQMMCNNNILTRICTSMLNDTMVNSAGVLYLHKVYIDFKAQNELRAYFYEEGMGQFFEQSLTDCVHVSFDWRTGFGLDCPKYVLVRVPGGYRILDENRETKGYMLKVNDEVFTYGDLTEIITGVH